MENRPKKVAISSNGFHVKNSSHDYSLSFKFEVGKIAPNLLKRDFHTYKPNEKWVTEISKYIDYYNHNRIKAKLKGMSPVQYRTHAQKIA